MPWKSVKPMEEKIRFIGEDEGREDEGCAKITY